MNTRWVAAAAVVLAGGLSAGAALADGPRPSSSHAIAQSAARQAQISETAMPRYEWQYHYVGHHPHLVGYWAVVR